jgi:hypothetical protein
MRVACCKFITVIRLLRMFLPRVQTEFTKVIRVYDYFEDKVYLFIVHLCNRVVGSKF